MGENGVTKKAIRLQRLELTDKHGRVLAVIGAEQGVPYMARFDGKGRILGWLTFMVDGTPDVRFFDACEAANKEQRSD